MKITPFKPEYYPEMAALFAQNFKKLRQTVPILPDAMEAPERVETMVRERLASCPGVVALDAGEIVGYLGWFVVDHFRGTERRGAYVPEWGHAVAEGREAAIYRAMYRAAAERWVAAGCGVHAITLLAHDKAAEKAWFWNGFGLTVVDAIRSTAPLAVPAPAGIQIRKATLSDIDALCALEAEHARHYTQPPVLMSAYEPWDADALEAFMAQPHHSLWLALEGQAYVGYMRFEPNGDGASAVVDAPDKIANTGAYVRPQYRGRRVAPALLDAALQDYAAQGFARCSVDFESFNPEAANFWLRYFEPVCLSVIRVPERC